MSTGKVEDRLTAGLDLGDLYTHMCVLDEKGEVVEEARVSSTPKAFRQRFQAMPPARLVLEAGTLTGTFIPFTPLPGDTR
jgi:hypothetical protein